jgi:hypothetical protein
MKIGEYETHPLADAFPLLVGEDYEAFKADIKDNGLRDRDIWLHKGLLLDGRNRLRACIDICKSADVKPRFREWEGDPMAFVVSANIHRRQLNPSQRAIVACRLCQSKPGRRPKTTPRTPLLRDVSEAMGVSESLIKQARQVMDGAIDDVITAVDRGDITIATALELVPLPHEQQLELLNKALAGGDNRRARSNIVRQGTRRNNKDEAPDTAMVLARAFIRTTTQLGGTVKQGTTDKDDEGRTVRCKLLVGFQGRELTLTIAVDDPELA